MTPSGHSPDSDIGQDWEFRNSSLKMTDFRLFMMVTWRRRGCGRGEQCFQKTNLAKVDEPVEVQQRLVARSAHRHQPRTMEGTGWKDIQGKQKNRNRNLSGFRN